MSKKEAMKALSKKKDVAIIGPDASGKGQRLAKERWGKNYFYDVPANYKVPEPGLPHYQYKNGRQGHIYIDLNGALNVVKSVGPILPGLTAVGNFGENPVTQTIDFFKPASDLKDIIEESTGESTEASNWLTP